VSEMKGTQLTDSVPYGWGADDFSDGEDDAKIVLPRVPRRAKWDCATILSTYTNTENHPRVLADVQVPASASVASKQAFSRATGAPKMIMLSAKTGVPLGVPLRGEPVKKPEEDDKQPSEGGSTSGSNSDGEDKAPVNLGVARSREETAEEKKARKREVKEARKVIEHRCYRRLRVT
jgi:protein LTV1